MDKTLNYIDSRAIKVTNEMKQAFVNYVKNNPNGEIDGIKLNNLDNILNPSINTLNNDGITIPNSQIDPSQNIQSPEANPFINNNQISQQPVIDENLNQNINEMPTEQGTQLQETNPDNQNIENTPISENIQVNPETSNQINNMTSASANDENNVQNPDSTIPPLADVNTVNNNDQNINDNQNILNTPADETTHSNPLSAEEISNQIDNTTNQEITNEEYNDQTTPESILNNPSEETIQPINQTDNATSQETSNIENNTPDNIIPPLADANTLNNNDQNINDNQNILNTLADETEQSNPLSTEEISNQTDNATNQETSNIENNTPDNIIPPLADANTLNNNDQNINDNQNILNTPADETTQANPLSAEEISNQIDNTTNQEITNEENSQLSGENKDQTTPESILNNPSEETIQSINQTDNATSQETSNEEKKQLSENNDQNVNKATEEQLAQENNDQNTNEITDDKEQSNNQLVNELDNDNQTKDFPDNDERPKVDIHVFDPTKDDPYPDRDVILPNGNGYSLSEKQDNTIKEVKITPLDEQTKEEYEKVKAKDDLDTTLEHEEKEPITPEIDDPYEFSLNLINNDHNGIVGEMAAKEIWNNLAKTYDEEKKTKDMPSVPKIPVVKTHAVGKNIDISSDAPAIFTLKVHTINNKNVKENNMPEVKLPEVLDDDIIENERHIPLEKVKTIINKKIDPSDALDDVLKETGVTDKMFDTKKKINLKNLTIFDNYDDYIFEFAKDYYKTEAVTRKQLDYLTSVDSFLSKEEFEARRREQYRQITLENENLKKKIQELNDNFTKKLEDINKLYDENVDKVVKETKYIRDSAEKDRIRKDQTDRLNKFLAKQVKEQVNKINSLNDNVKKLKTSNSTKSSEIKSLKRSKKKAKNKLKNLENK